MHHEHDLDYEREDDLRRREDDWGYAERSRYERDRLSGRRYGREGYGRGYGREGMPGAGGTVETAVTSSPRSKMAASSRA